MIHFLFSTRIILAYRCIAGYRRPASSLCCSSTTRHVRVKRKISFNEVIGWRRRRWRQAARGILFLRFPSLFEYFLSTFFSRFEQPSTRKASRSGCSSSGSRSPRGGETFGPGPGGTYCAILNNSKKHIGNISDDSSLSLSLSLIFFTILSKQVSCVAFLLGGSKNSSFFFLFFYSRAEGVAV